MNMSDTITKVRDEQFQLSFNQFIAEIENRIEYDLVNINLAFNGSIVLFAYSSKDGNVNIEIGTSYPLDGSTLETVFTNLAPLINDPRESSYSDNGRFTDFNFKSAIHFPLFLKDKKIGSLDFLSYKDNHYSDTDVIEVEKTIDTLTLLLENFNLHNIIKKSEALLNRHPLDMDYLFKKERDPLESSSLDEYIKDILNNLNEFIFVENIEAKVIQVSPSLAELLSYDIDDIIGKSVRDFCDPEYIEDLDSLLDSNEEKKIHFLKQDGNIIPFFIKAYQVKSLKQNHNVVIYHVSHDPNPLKGDILNQMQGQFGVVDLSYHVQYASPLLENDFDEAIAGRKCFHAYNKTNEICKYCPIENNLLDDENLKKHIVFTEFKDGQKKMILFTLLVLDDGTKVLLEFFKETAFQGFLAEEEEPEEIIAEEFDDKDAPNGLVEFVDYSVGKVKSPVSTLLNYIITLQNIPFKELNEEIFLEKMKFMYHTAKHLESVILGMVERLKERIRVQQTLLDNAEKAKEEESKKVVFPSVEGKTILVIEPNDNFRESLVNFLEKINYTVFPAKDGLEGILETKKHLPDMILLEVNIPKVNGLLFVEKIKQHIKKKIPCIVISDINNPEIIKRSFQIGVQEYLQKSPLDLQDLSNLIYNVFTQKPKKISQGKETAALPATETKDVLQEPKQEIQEEEKLHHDRAAQDIEPEIEHQSPAYEEEYDETDDTQSEVEDNEEDQVVEEPEEKQQDEKEDLVLEDFGIIVEENEEGFNFDSGKEDGIKYQLQLDDDIVVLKINGFLEENTLNNAVLDLKKMIEDQSPENRKIIFNLNEVVAQSATQENLDLLFSFQQEFMDIPPEYVKLVTNDFNTQKMLKDHFIGKGYRLYHNTLDAYTDLKMN